MKICRRIVFPLIFALCFSAVDAQSYRYIDSIMRICPNEYARSVESLAGYIGKKFSTGPAKLRAAYSWVAQHISYDVANAVTTITYKDENELIVKALQTRKAVCSGYAKTFRAIAGKLGLEVAEISGYTEQNDEISHAWCAVKIAGKWKLIDPTWSSGYVDAGKFYKKFDDKWFLVNPEQMIQTHIPFDPVWQFSYFPINGREFHEKTAADSVTARFFSYPDTINAINALKKISEQEHLLAVNRRIAAAGIHNAAAKRHIAANVRVLESITNNEKVKTYNQAVDLYNKASNLYNKSGKNPKNSTANLQQANSLLSEASKILDEIKQADEDLGSSIVKLRKSINTLQSNIAKIS